MLKKNKLVRGQRNRYDTPKKRGAAAWAARVKISS